MIMLSAAAALPRSGAVTLLDIACGTGGITAVLAGAFRVSALDISAGMLAAARERLPPGTPLYQADMRSFDLDAKFDVVVCSYQAVTHLLGFTAWSDFSAAFTGISTMAGCFFSTSPR